MHRLLFLIGMTAPLTVLLAAGAVPNASFELLKSGNGEPEQWHVRRVGNSKTRVKSIATPAATDGRRVLRLECDTPYNQQVFSLIFTRLTGVTPGQTGRVSFDVRGTSNASFSLICGEWSQRYYLRDLTPEWKRRSFPFTVQAKDLDAAGNYTLRFCIQSETKGIEVDDLRFEPDVQVIKPTAFRQFQTVPLPKIENWRSLKTIPAGLVSFDLNGLGRIAVAAADNGPLLLAEVNAPNPTGKSGAGMYAADSVQFRLDPTYRFESGDRASDRELGFSLLPNGSSATWCWQLNRELKPDEAQTVAIRTPKGWFLAARLNPALLPGFDWTRNGAFGFNAAINVLVNGERRCAALAHGILDGKSSRNNFAAIRQHSGGGVRLSPVSDGREFCGEFLTADFQTAVPWNYRAVLIGADGKRQEFAIADAAPAVAQGELLLARFHLPLEALPDGAFTLELLAGERKLTTIKSVKADPAAGLNERLGAIEARFAALLKIAAKFPASAEKQLFQRVCERQISLLKRDFKAMNSPQEKNFYAMRGRLVLNELDAVLHQFQAFLDGGAKPAAQPELLRKNASFDIGYGHFMKSAVEDMEHLPGFAANLIQIDLGPNAFFRTEKDLRNPDFRVFDQLVGTALDRGAKYGLKVCVLLNPHYVPNWWKKKYPARLNPGPSNPFEPYRDWEDPEVKKLIQSYLDVILPRLAAHPNRKALHSICLTNEVVYRTPQWNNPEVRKLFRDGLAQKYGSLKAFNLAAGRNFASWQELDSVTPESDRAIRFAFHRWKRERLAGFHRWMGGQVRAALPDVPQSTKIMVFAAMRPSRLEDAVDPELFAELSDYNGNDNYMLFGKGGYIASWQQTAMWHDLQYSLKPVPILNSENHVVTDGDYTPIPAEFFHTNIFQQAIHKTGGIVTWVWMDIDYALHAAKSSRDANIYHRPAGILGQGRGALDVNRLALAIRRFQTAAPEVELLYSPAAFIQDSHAYIARLEALYEALSFAGFRIGFRSERQLARGENGRAPILILPEVCYLDRQALPGLKKFTENGGKLYFSGKKPQFDEFGNPLAGLPNGTLLSSVDELAPNRPVSLKVNHADGNRGVPWQLTDDANGRILLNAVNFNFEPRRLNLTIPPGRRMTDLISGRDYPAEFELKPLTPLLLELK